MTNKWVTKAIKFHNNRENNEHNMKLNELTKGIIALFTVAFIALMAQSFVTAEPSSLSAGDKYRTFVKTKNKCHKSNCSCSGYWGYKHGNGTYEGTVKTPMDIDTPVDMARKNMVSRNDK